MKSYDYADIPFNKSRGVEIFEKKTYVFRWPDGTERRGRGTDAQNAMLNLGYAIEEFLELEYYYEDRSDSYET